MLLPAPTPRSNHHALRVSLEGIVMAVILFLFLEVLFHGPQTARDWTSLDFSAMLGSSTPEYSSNEDATAHLHRLLAQTALDETGICSDCNATISGDFATSASFSNIPLLDRAAARAVFMQPGQNAGKALLKRYLIHHVPLAATVSGIWINSTQQSPLLSNYLSAPDNLLSYNLEGLRLDLPTAYIYTRTGGTRFGNKRRLEYLQMHHDTIHTFEEKVKTDGYMDGVRFEDRQLLHIVVRDESTIDPEIEDFFRSRSIPYIYFAVGPTRKIGIAQWNAVERAIEVVRDTFFGDGPVLNIDDDARISPELLDRFWKVKKMILWPVGNIRPGGWEGLMCENGRQHHWRTAWLPNRVFPIDMQGFAVNSSLIGTGRSISGPRYVPHSGTLGETKFLEQVSLNREDAECLCDNTLEEGCFLAWHNWKVPNVEKNAQPLTDEQYRSWYEEQQASSK